MTDISTEQEYIYYILRIQIQGKAITIKAHRCFPQGPPTVSLRPWFYCMLNAFKRTFNHFNRSLFVGFCARMHLTTTTTTIWQKGISTKRYKILHSKLCCNLLLMKIDSHLNERLQVPLSCFNFHKTFACLTSTDR